MTNYIPTPNYYEYIAHHGVKGQRWGHRKKTYDNGLTYRQMKKGTKADKKVFKKEAKSYGLHGIGKRFYVKQKLMDKYGQTSIIQFDKDRAKKHEIAYNSIIAGVAALSLSALVYAFGSTISNYKNPGKTRVKRAKTKPVKEKFRIEDQRTIDRTPKDFVDAKYDKRRGIYR